MSCFFPPYLSQAKAYYHTHLGGSQSGSRSTAASELEHGALAKKKDTVYCRNRRGEIRSGGAEDSDEVKGAKLVWKKKREIKLHDAIIERKLTTGWIDWIPARKCMLALSRLGPFHCRSKLLYVLLSTGYIRFTLGLRSTILLYIWREPHAFRNRCVSYQPIPLQVTKEVMRQDRRSWYSQLKAI